MNKAKLLLLLRQEGVTDSRILSAFESVPREIFVDELFKNYAYENVSLPIDCGGLRSSWAMWSYSCFERLTVAAHLLSCISVSITNWQKSSFVVQRRYW